MRIESGKDVEITSTRGSVSVLLPLTLPTGKVRVKLRSFFSDYGEPVASRSVPISQSCYVEWQIGYDLLATPDNASKTSLSAFPFENYKGERKFAYELAEIVHFALKGGLIHREDVLNCARRIEGIEEKATFEETAVISRTIPKEETINGLKFYAMKVTYPLFVHRFGQYEIISEILIKEKQRAVGAQAMLYLCIPVSVLNFNRPVFGRTLDAKERGKWQVGKEEAQLSLELFNVFGMLSPKHRFDVLQILKVLTK